LARSIKENESQTIHSEALPQVQDHPPAGYRLCNLREPQAQTEAGVSSCISFISFISLGN